MSTIDPSIVIGITQLAAETVAAVYKAESDGPTPSELASRLVDIGVGLVPVAELRGYLDALDAASADRIVDIAEEAKLAAKKLGG
jgi:hypothetical protein